MENLKKLIAPVGISLAVMIAFYAFVIQPQLVEDPIVVESQSVTRFNTPVFFQDTVTNQSTVSNEGAVTMDGALTVTGASTLTGNVAAAGTLGVTGLSTLSGGATIVGTVTVDAGAIGSTAIANISRTVSISLISFMECTTDAGANIDFSDDADAFPDFTGIATDGLGFFLEYDSTSATEDTARACNNLSVPEDYASDGKFELVVGKDAETGANTEVINCAGSIGGAALGTVGTVTISGTALVAYSCVPTLTGLAAGNYLGFTLYVTSGGTVDDDTNIYSVGFQYTATQ